MAYNEKHNEANGEDNQDGESHNRSWNHGVEGPTDDPEIQRVRSRQQRNLLATLFLSQGVPMLLGGDELGRTQHGNNNAYCQDNELSWFDWDDIDTDLLAFTRNVIELRREHPVFRRRRWFFGRPIRGTVDIGWCRPDGEEMTDEDWETAEAKAVGLFLNGHALQARDDRGRVLVDDDFLLLANAASEDIRWKLPRMWAPEWEVVLRTDAPDGLPDRVTRRSTSFRVGARSLVLFRAVESE